MRTPITLLILMTLIADHSSAQILERIAGARPPARSREVVRTSRSAISARAAKVKSPSLTGSVGSRRLVPQDHPTIQAAIDASVDGDTVLVSEGTYFENIRYRGKAIVVGSRYLLDGDTSHISRTVIDGSRTACPDSGSVVSFVDGEDTTSVLCGLTVRGGTGTVIGFLDVNGIPFWGRAGGGVWIDFASARVVRNIITRNRIIGRTASGGALAVNGDPGGGSFLILEGNQISENFVFGDSLGLWGGYSGGVDIYYASARVVGNLFDRDTVIAPHLAVGGALAFIESGSTPSGFSAIIAGNAFRQNCAVETPPNGLARSYAGAFHCETTGNVDVLDNTFERNLVLGLLGEARGGAVCAYGLGRAVFRNNQFVGNVAQSGGGVTHAGALKCWDTRGVIVGNLFLENKSIGTGVYGGNGGAVVAYGELWISGNTFLRNVGISTTGGGGAGGGLFFMSYPGDDREERIVNNLFVGNSVDWGGGGIASHQWSEDTTSGMTIIANNTIIGNRARAMGGGIGIIRGKDHVILNNIVHGNMVGAGDPGPNQIEEMEWPALYYHNAVQGGWHKGFENIDVDPGFEPGSFVLSDTSACIGAGIDSILIGDTWHYAPQTDFSGSPRPVPPGSSIDIGAVENPLPLGINQPPLLLSPRSLDFRNVRPGSVSDTLTIRIRNRKTMGVDLSTLSLTGEEYRLALAPRLPVRLRGLQSFDLDLLFSPTDSGMTFQDTLRIETEDERQPDLNVPLTGRGSGPVCSAGGMILFGISSCAGGPVLHILNKVTGFAQPIGAFSPSPPPFCNAIAIRPRDSILYAASSSLAGTDLYRLSTAFGDLDIAWTIPLGNVRSMAFSRSDSLYIVTGDGRLYRGSIGSTDTLFLGFVGRPLTGLAFSPATGVLWGSHRDSLFTIDPQSGDATLQGVNTWNAPHSSITFNGVGTMYALYGEFLVSIDKGTGMARYIGETKVSDLRWIAMRSDIVTGMEEEESVPGPVWELTQNYPNPFNAGTVIRYQLPAEAHAMLTVYDILGREVATLVDEPQRAGEHSVRFDGTKLASGIYIYRLTSGTHVQSRRMILIR